MSGMKFLPLCVRIDNIEILFLGGGAVALHKLKTVMLYTSRVTVCAPEILPEIQLLGVEILQCSYSKDILNGFKLVYACTDNREVNRQIGDDAHSLGILVNVADDPEYSSFVSPAVFKEGKISVAVSSDASDVKKSIAWRDQIAAYLKDSNGVE